MSLTKQQLLSAGPKRERLDIPQLNDSVMIRQLTAGEVVQYVRLQQSGKLEEAIALVITSGVISEDTGSPMFSDDDVKAIMDLGHEVPNRIVEGVLKLSNLVKQETESDPN